MGKTIQPNHVRYIKGEYSRSRRNIAKSKNISLKQALKNDIENFNFQKVFGDFKNLKFEKSEK